MENKVISGVYKIENTLNGKLYIGSSLDVMRRWRSHVSLLNRGTHYSIHLQNAWNKYGQKSFSFKVLSKVSEGKILLKIEQWHLDYYKPFGSLGYNVLPTAGSPRGYSFTEKHKENLSRSHTGHIHSMETRQKNVG